MGTCQCKITLGLSIQGQPKVFFNLIFRIHKIYFSEKGRRDLERKRLSADEHSNDAQLTAARDMEEARQRVLNALKTSFAKQRNDGLISDDAVTVLNQAVNSVQNENQSGQFVSLNQLKRNWKLFGFLPKVSNIKILKNNY